MPSIEKPRCNGKSYFPKLIILDDPLKPNEPVDKEKVNKWLKECFSERLNKVSILKTRLYPKHILDK